MNINQNYLDLENSYLFSSISKKVSQYKADNPDKRVISLGIGDVTLPLAPAVIKAMTGAVTEMGEAASFRGYGEEQGYGFLRQAICGYYSGKNVDLNENEVFISDGAKSDLGNILDIFSADNTVMIPNPVYPVYVDTNIMAGRKIVYINGNVENKFLPMPDKNIKADIIYLCSPNNPTGAVYTREQLGEWVEYATCQGAVILFDSAYETFVRDKTLPTSIYEIPGAKKCAIEFCSLSKTAGFTGVRCGYTVVPQELEMQGVSLNKLWLRRQTTKFNGVPYIVQCGAAAVFEKENAAQIKAATDYYLDNARTISKKLNELGIWYVGGENSPYIWMKCPDGMSSWEYFDHLLFNANIIGTPGVGFGAKGEGFFRLTSFAKREDIEIAMKSFG